MPPPGFRGGRGGFRGGFGRPGIGAGPRWGPGFRPGPGPLGVIGAVATGAAVAAVVAPPPRRRYPRPRTGYIYVVPVAGQPPREVRAEEASFIISRVEVTSHQQGSGGEIHYEIQVTMNDGYKYGILRRYSQFDELRVRTGPVLRIVPPPFPPKYGMRSAMVGLRPGDLEERRLMFQTWLQSLCTAASTTNPALRLPVYDFLETALYYPPELPASAETAAGTAAGAGAVPYATATPYAEPVAAAGALPPPPPVVPQVAKSIDDGWSIPVESREASDLKFAMSGPDASGRLAPGKVSEALRGGTGATSEELRAVWELSDIDKDGMLDRDEFAVAWYLAHQAAAGNKPPASLPADIVPPSKRPAAPTSFANPF